MANKQVCPRCGSSKIVEYDTTFGCRECNLEFQKEISLDLDEEDVLSIKEMKGILDELGLKQNSNKLTKLKDVLDMKESFDQNKHKN